jgi:indolepyruvate ferredoxin oxidoreductase beta subunit
MEPFRVVIAGVGGQGTLLASRLLAQSAIEDGHPIRIGETYGMAQRGGPVMSHIQIGGKVNAPQICPGKADVLLGFEEGEAVRRGITYMKLGGLALVNSRRLPPVEVISGMVEYPSSNELMSLLSKITDSIISFDAMALAEEAGDPITANVVMLGALCESGLLPFPEATVIEVLRRTVRPTYHAVNLKAFELGKRAFKGALS